MEIPDYAEMDLKDAVDLMNKRGVLIYTNCAVVVDAALGGVISVVPQVQDCAQPAYASVDDDRLVFTMIGAADGRAH